MDKEKDTMADVLITEYSETIKTAQMYDNYADDDSDFFEDPEAIIITFSEGPDEDIPHLMTEELAAGLHGTPEVVFHELDPDHEEPEVDDDEMMDAGDREAMSFTLPGAVDYVEDHEEEEEPEEVDDGSNTDWEHDRDVRHFMPYITRKIQEIPKHDGASTLGCERAEKYLIGLNKEISEALRMDPSGGVDGESPLDLSALERIRIDILKGITALKERVKELNKKHKKKKKAEDIVSVIKEGESVSELQKEATTARFQMVITPFERAITGMIINAVVSAGKPLEDVYSHLKKKYGFTNREELSIIQLLSDMGQPIFKDRGMIGEVGEDAESVDFMTNYFA